MKKGLPLHCCTDNGFIVFHLNLSETYYMSFFFKAYSVTNLWSVITCIQLYL